MAVARSSSGGVAIRYVFPVLWMLLFYVTFGHNARNAKRGRLHCAATAMSGVVILGQSLMSMHALLHFAIQAEPTSFNF